MKKTKGVIPTKANLLGKTAPIGESNLFGKTSLSRTAPLIASWCTLLLLAAGSTFAHHSPAVFDRTKQVTISGIVKEFRWSNPHSWIHLDVAGTDGAVEAWTVEMDPASHLGRRGWKSTTVEIGDKVAVLVYPLRNDEKGGQYISITLPDGTVMDEAGQPIQVLD